jgi:hypothetical protein
LVIGVELESYEVRGFMSPVFQRDVKAILNVDGVGLIVVLVPMWRGYTFHTIHIHADGVIWYGGGDGGTRWSLGGWRSRAVGGKGSGEELFMFWAVRLNMFTQRGGIRGSSSMRSLKGRGSGASSMCSESGRGKVEMKGEEIVEGGVDIWICLMVTEWGEMGEVL